MAQRPVRHRGRWTLDDRAGQFYRYLPVDVPPGISAVMVRLIYECAAGVLDLGCFGPAGFRGWSGGARSTFTVADTWATPGYLPGPVEPGEWNIVLGLHRVPVEGIEYDVEVTLSSDVLPPPDPPALPVVPSRRPTRDLPAEPGLRWLAGDLHSHSVHSDGSLTVDELACLAVEAGLDFLAVTDHNTVSHHPHLAAAAGRSGVQLLPGQEVTRDHGHANAFGDIGWIDFRQPADEWMAETARRGGLLSVNHPLAADCAWRHTGTARPPLAEIWHWTWSDRTWGGPLAWWAAWGREAVAVGGSDFHTPAHGRPLGVPTTWVQTADGDVLAALAAGRVAVNAGRDEPLLLRVGDEMVALGAEGTLLVDPTGGRRVVPGQRYAVPAAAGPHRLESATNAVVALAT